MYTEQSGGLALNYGFPELGLNRAMLMVLICTLNEPSFCKLKQPDIWSNVQKLQNILAS